MESVKVFDLAFCNLNVLKVSLHHLRLKLLKLLLESMHEVRSTICLHLQTREIFTKKDYFNRNKLLYIYLFFFY